MFLSRLNMDHIPGFRRWILTEDLIYMTRGGETITVDQGFETDLASVPRLFWNIFPPAGIYLEAAVVHDYMYEGKYEVKDKKTADRIFREAMADLKVPKWKRWVLWAAVRVGGRGIWR